MSKPSQRYAEPKQSADPAEIRPFWNGSKRQPDARRCPRKVGQSRHKNPRNDPDDPIERSLLRCPGAGGRGVLCCLEPFRVEIYALSPGFWSLFGLRYMHCHQVFQIYALSPGFPRIEINALSPGFPGMDRRDNRTHGAAEEKWAKVAATIQGTIPMIRLSDPYCAAPAKPVGSHAMLPGANPN